MGGSKLEETLYKKVELIGWVVLLLIVFAVVLYTSLPAS